MPEAFGDDLRVDAGAQGESSVGLVQVAATPAVVGLGPSWQLALAGARPAANESATAKPLVSRLGARAGALCPGWGNR